MPTHEINRQTIRLKGYDYSQPGMYYVTICTQNHENVFGNITNGEMILNKYGEIVKKCWVNIPIHFKNTKIDEYIIMPNHIHGIIEICDGEPTHDISMDIPVGANNYSPLPQKSLPPQNQQISRIVRPRGTSRTIGSMVRGFKIGVTNQIGQSVWQRNYYEHIIRDDESYHQIVQYIRDNPKKWENDLFNGNNINGHKK